LVHIGHVSIGGDEVCEKEFKRVKWEVFVLKRGGGGGGGGGGSTHVTAERGAEGLQLYTANPT